MLKNRTALFAKSFWDKPILFYDLIGLNKSVRNANVIMWLSVEFGNLIPWDFFAFRWKSLRIWGKIDHLFIY